MSLPVAARPRHFPPGPLSFREADRAVTATRTAGKPAHAVPAVTSSFLKKNAPRPAPRPSRFPERAHGRAALNRPGRPARAARGAPGPPATGSRSGGPPGA
ncbi:hypothetical protein QR78_30060 [Methylobacterium indicum]|uniref:Uncharacterized protein n=1 Tax=Methylobacterium indicum TaxID=1775910 RepID=A0ABR5HDM9_9HYPH|nr:hypothetical protein QR78_30060 [Methylobacterium indicum]KMO24476.1 hypothetical protein QR79_11575 [Methylobacterium indicum]